MSPVGARDRDDAGRARNARPRDALGRPLPYGSTPEQGAVPAIPDDLEVTPAEALVLAQHLIDEGRPFAAHEVLEAAWKAAPGPERGLWQGLAQVCVGLTHLRRGNRTGGATLLRRGADRIAPYDEAPPYGIDVAGVVAWARRVAEDRPGAEPLRLTRRTGRSTPPRGRPQQVSPPPAPR